MCRCTAHPDALFYYNCSLAALRCPRTGRRSTVAIERTLRVLPETHVLSCPFAPQ